MTSWCLLFSLIFCALLNCGNDMDHGKSHCSHLIAWGQKKGSELIWEFYLFFFWKFICFFGSGG